MNIETIIALIGAIGGLSGFISAIATVVFQIVKYKKEQKAETLDSKLETVISPIRERLEAQAEELHEIRLDTLRTQLYIKMEHEPHNHDTILTIAHRYFVVEKGDWVATTDFQAWADKEQIKIPNAIQLAIVENDKK